MRSFVPYLALVVTVIFVAPSLHAADAPSRDSIEFFETRIRPVLVEKCYSCHSEQSKKLKGDLKVDSAAALLRGGESGMPSVVPGHPEKSKLIEAIGYKTEDMQMPPKEKLAPAVIADFTAWVQMGAPDPRISTAAPTTAAASMDIATAKKEWWSFHSPQPQTPPTVKNTAWGKTPIDAFILAKLEAKSIAPSKRADKHTLIRRATFDLTGLPPTPEEAAAFEADQSPDAYEKLVDRLLASPHYGERWARYWLDVCRYADSKGYVFQEERRYPFAYTFRDWVVRAFNEDLPYDQFIIQQLAADKVTKGDDNRPLAAMGFLTVGRRFLNSQPEIIDDRLDVVCRGLMGISVGCARCHDHKFDPVPTKDYYSLYGVFASSTEPKDLPEIGSEKTPATESFEKERAKLVADIDAFHVKRVGEISADLRTAKSISAYLIAVRDDEKKAGQEIDQKRNLRRRAMDRWKAFLIAQPRKGAVFGAWFALKDLPDDQISAKWEEAAKAGNPLLAAAFTAKPPASVKDVADRYGEVLDTYSKPEVATDANEEALRLVTYGPAAAPVIAVAEAATYFNRKDNDEDRNLRNKVDALTASHPGSPARAMVMVDLPKPVQPHVFKRGNPGMQGDAVPRQFLAIASPLDRQPFKEGSGRLELARSIASKDNPLTARVMVNRIWGHHFGSALVRTPSDFGRRGELPTHPELLDYLAIRFVDENWSIKKLHKLIMLSATYQQVSDNRSAASNIDPENRLLWKMNRQRLDFEAMRDSVLAVSGQIDLAVGGKSVELTATPFPHRRTIYGFIDRQNLPGVFRAFDFASPDTHSPQRFQTTVPQQALYMMNSPFVLDSAKSLARRSEVARESENIKKIQSLYHLALDRSPSKEELDAALAFVKDSLGKSDFGVWEELSQVLLESNEFMFVD